MAGDFFANMPNPANVLSRTPSASLKGANIPGVSDASKMVDLGATFNLLVRKTEDPAFMAEMRAAKQQGMGLAAAAPTPEAAPAPTPAAAPAAAPRATAQVADVYKTPTPSPFGRA